MTVSELINELKKKRQDAKVVFIDAMDGGEIEVVRAHEYSEVVILE